LLHFHLAESYKFSEKKIALKCLDELYKIFCLLNPRLIQAQSSDLGGLLGRLVATMQQQGYVMRVY
jgi:hypothetical protein